MTPDKMAEVFEAVQVLTLRTGDVVVFRASVRVSQSNQDLLVTMLSESLGHPKEKILVLDSAAQLDIIRPEESPAPTRPWWRFW